MKNYTYRKIYTYRTFKAKVCKDFGGNHYIDFQYEILFVVFKMKSMELLNRNLYLGINLTKMIQLQYQQLDRHKMIYQYDATEIYIAPQMNLINLEDMGTSIEFKDFPLFSSNETHF